mmetsp:Transcript_23293/g.16578  ORF Transcript_23293/g.16578 Transcript_23293/m.16578 type:complete len:85 (+) Transcript_23293:524-778(+)
MVQREAYQVDIDPLLLFCPNLKCGQVITRRSTSCCSDITCGSCGQRVCNSCQGPYHGMSPCRSDTSITGSKCWNDIRRCPKCKS